MSGLINRAIARANLKGVPLPNHEAVQARQEWLQKLSRYHVEGNSPYLVLARERGDRILEFATDEQAQRQELARCATDASYWCDRWIWTYDPRIYPTTVPFRLWGKQRDYLNWRRERIERREHGLIEKSRDQGVSWLNVVDHLHKWLFQQGFKGGFASRKESLVDKIGDVDSIMEKLRFILRSLPYWMVPSPKDYMDGYLKLINYERGSTITGESGVNVGRGGRCTVLDLDEAAYLIQPAKVDAAVSQNADIVFWTSTPNGMNLFAKKRFSGTIPVFRFFWKEDPRKNYWEVRSGDRLIEQGKGEDAPAGAVYPWYEKLRVTLEPVVLAQEVDISYTASVEGIFINSDWVLAAIDLPVAASGLPIAGFDPATEGKNRNVLCIRQGPKVLGFWDWSGLDTTQSTAKAIQICRDWGVRLLSYDGDGVGAGVSAALHTFRREGRPMPKYKVFHGASRPSKRTWPVEGITSQEKFHNARAEVWGILRDRFRKSYEVANGIAHHPEGETIAIPSETNAIAQFSAPIGMVTSGGKILLESKEDMRKRGIESPDYADACAYAFGVDVPDMPTHELYRSGGQRWSARSAPTSQSQSI
jgi:hypothetical protein